MNKWDDLREWLGKASDYLDGMAKERNPNGPEHERLKAKKSGVDLALSYMDDIDRMEK